MIFVDLVVGGLKQFVKVHYSGVSGVLQKCGGMFRGIWIWGRLDTKQEGNWE